jgi:alkyl hydroperoxide reductase subunit AhpC
MSIHIGDVGPNFTADTTTGTLDFHEWVGGDWVSSSAIPATSRRSARLR